MANPFDPVNPSTYPALGTTTTATVPPVAPTTPTTIAPTTVPVTTTPTKNSNGWGDVPRGILSSLLPGIVKPNDLTLFTDHNASSKATTTNTPEAKILSQLQAAGYDTPTANSLLQQYKQTAAKNEAIKNLPPEFADIIKAHDASQTPQTPQQRIMDPLAMQLFFQNTVAPYLDKTGASIKATAAGMGDTMKQLLPSLPPAYQSVLAQSLPGTQAGMSAMADAMSGAAVAAPAVQSLQNQLAAAWQAQKLAQYYAEKNIAYSGGANSTGVPTADEIAQISQLLNPSGTQ